MPALRLPTYPGTVAAAVYGLFAFSTFSIAGAELCSILLYGFALWEYVRHGARPEPPRWVLAAFLAYPAWMAFSALTHPDVWGGLDIVRGQYRVFLPLVLPLFLARVDVRRVLAVYGALMLLMSLYAVAQYFTGVDLFRPEGQKLAKPYLESGAAVFHGKGNFSHHLIWAGAVLMTVPLSAALALGAAGRWRWFWGVLALAGAAGLLASLGRSGWAGAAVGLLVLGLVWGGRVRWAALALGLAAVLGATVLLSGALPRPQGGRLGALVARLESTGLQRDAERLILWKVAAHGVWERPLLGNGPARRVFDAHRDALAEREGITRFSHPHAMAHNMYLQIAFAAGVPGLLLFLGLWAAVLAQCARFLKRDRDAPAFDRALVRGLTAALAGALVFGLFQNHFNDAIVQTHIVMMMGLALYVTGKARPAPKGKKRAK
jgi:O-antigen ligase